MLSLAAIWASLTGAASAISEGLKALGVLLGLIQQQQQKQAGIDAQRAADAESEVAALRAENAVLTKGQTDAETLDDLKSGRF